MVPGRDAPRGRGDSTVTGGSVLSPWGLAEAFGAIVIAIIGSGIVAGLLGAGRHPSIGEQVLINLPLWAAFIGVPLWATSRRGAGPVADLGLSFRPVDLIGLPLGVAMQFLVGLLYLPFVDQHEVDAPARDLVNTAHGAGGKFLLILMTVVLAPVAEEIFYRGLVLTSLRRALPAWAAVVITGVVFGVMHFEWLQLGGLALFGILAGALAVKTGRLGPAILAHVGFNAIALVHLLG